MPRTPAATLDEIPGELPNATLPDDLNIPQVAGTAVDLLNEWNTDALTEGVIWRDFVALTGTYRTLHGRKKVYDIFQRLGAERQRSNFKLAKEPPRTSHSGEESAWLDVEVDFTIKLPIDQESGSAPRDQGLVGNCSGIVSVIHCTDGSWHIWMVRTWLESFAGHGHPDKPLPSADQQATTNGNGHPDAGTSRELRNGHDEIYDAIVVGGSQAGLSAAGRLQALGLKYLVLEQNAEIGDAWKNRYESLLWHTIRDYGELPFGNTFTAEDPVLVPARRIGLGHKGWSERYGIKTRPNTRVDAADWHDGDSTWTVRTSTGIVFKSRNVILAIGGGSASPVRPAWAVQGEVESAQFSGTVLHSADYQSCKAWAGQKGIIVGTANTGHDIAEDMERAGMTTTMIQRNATFVFPAEWLHFSQEIDYNRTKSTVRADWETYTYPNKISREQINRAVHGLIRANPERFDALERAGFKLDRFGDIMNNLYVRLGGHYVDTGASAKIANGAIRIETRRVQGLTRDGVRLDDGTELAADLIVLCTGFEHDFRKQARAILGDAAERMDEYFGLDAEGEIRGLAKPAGHPHLYYHGGDVRIARFFSRFIALRIQAEKLGARLDVLA